MKDLWMAAALVMLLGTAMTQSLWAREGEQQVQVETKFVEVSQELDDLGLDWQQRGDQEVQLGAGADVGMDVARGIDRVPQLSASGFGDQAGVTMIRSLDKAGTADILNTPRVTMTGSQPAAIIPVETAPIVLTTPVVDTGINLDVVPRVQAAGGIQVSPVIVSEGSSELLSGVNLGAKPRGEVPILRRIPVIGPLFKSRAGKAAKAETTILVTPRIIKPKEA